MKVAALIPARWASTRFPGKALAPIAGEPMIVHVWRRARRAARVDRVVIATDDQRIVECCAQHGIEWLMTSSAHATGTDRLAEAAAALDAELIVNVQGDEPLIDPATIDAVVDTLHAGLARGIEVATAYLEGATPEQQASRSVVHLVPSLDGCVMLFSRLPVPCAYRSEYSHKIHVGLFAFTRAALARFAQWEQGPVERAESVELLRFIEHGERIACIPVPPGSIGVDEPEDVARVEAVLAAARTARGRRRRPG